MPPCRANVVDVRLQGGDDEGVEADLVAAVQKGKTSLNASLI